MTTSTRVNWITIPAGTSPSKCRGPNCRATIYWARGAAGAVPGDCDVEGGRRPSETNDAAQADIFSGTADVHAGRGVSHFATCVDADLFRKRDQ